MVVEETLDVAHTMAEADEVVDAVVAVGAVGDNQPRQNWPPDSHMITLTDGTQIEFHSSFSFPPRHAYMEMKPQDKKTLGR